LIGGWHAGAVVGNRTGSLAHKLCPRPAVPGQARDVAFVSPATRIRKQESRQNEFRGGQ
jgi:hypothetical protein